MYTMFNLHKLFVYLLDVCKYTCIFSVTNLCLQVVVRSELFDRNTIMLVAVGILIQGKYDLPYSYYGADQVAHFCTDL